MFYKFLKITIGSAVRIFFRKIVIIGQDNIPADKPVIFVSNHPSAFMDPLILGSFSDRELYFFARADIFSPGFVQWITKKAHMSPIYRIVDGMDSLEKNDTVFAHGYKLLSENKVLLLFGEGVTDEEFIRRVKPMKKGSMRISLGAERKFDFKLGVNIVCVGINYSDPRKFRSDLLIRFSKPLEVGKYKDLFLEHNNKAMIELNKEIYSYLKEQVVHVENPEHIEFFEQMLILTRKGINNDFYDENISLEDRWDYSKQLENWINKENGSISSLEGEPEAGGNASFEGLKRKISRYFKVLEEKGIDDSIIYKKPGKTQSLLFLFFLIGFPAFLYGLVCNYPPVKFSLFLSRKISKRPVFWSGTDMAFSLIFVPVYYSLIIFCLRNFAFLDYSFIILLLPTWPISGIFAFDYYNRFFSLWKNIKSRKILKEDKIELEKLAEERQLLLTGIEKIMAG